MNYPGLDPAILAALQARQTAHPHLVPLPAPGGPVDEGIYQAAHPNLVPLPRPGGPVDVGINQHLPLAEMKTALVRAMQNAAQPQQQRVFNPQAQRAMAVQNAHQQLLQRIQKTQHMRRYNGPYR